MQFKFGCTVLSVHISQQVYRYYEMLHISHLCETLQSISWRYVALKRYIFANFLEDMFFVLPAELDNKEREILKLNFFVFSSDGRLILTDDLAITYL